MISIFELQNNYMTLGLYSFKQDRHETRWKGHSKVHLERNKCKTIEQRVQESWNICESENNKDNKKYMGAEGKSKCRGQGQSVL